MDFNDYMFEQRLREMGELGFFRRDAEAQRSGMCDMIFSQRRRGDESNLLLLFVARCEVEQYRRYVNE
jgi:hypothetical protein